MKAKAFAGTLLLTALVLCANLTYSQAPQGFSYQAVIRNSSGQPIASQSVKVHIQLTDQLGTLIHYGEVHTLTTSPLGIASLTIGEGTLKQGALADVPWQNGNVFIKVEIDPTGTSGYQSMGDPVKLNSVPYALYAENTKEIVSLPDAVDTDPIFVVRNKIDQIVFAVYQSGVRAYVNELGVVKGTKGGFAIGGLTSKGTVDPPEYFRIYPDSARIYLNSAKGAKGGFAIGGLTSKGKTAPDQFLNLTPDNYFIGHQSGSKTTTGLNNSFFGYQTGKSNTTGARNAFIGYQAGFGNTEGYDNIFLGNAAGFNNTEGIDNIFLGTRSGKNNTSGERNIFLGSSSGEKNTTGYQNIAIGEQAGYSLQTGGMNIFIGTVAGKNNILGTENVFIGNSAGSENTGSRTVAIGSLAGGYSNNLGTNNVFLGYRSGWYNAGSSNVFIGEQSGNSNIEGSGNVFIGSSAGAQELGSNTLYIANTNTTTPLIYGEFVSRKVDVNGSVNLKDLLNLKPRTSYPGDPKIGDVFYDGNSKTIKYYEGTKWKALSATDAGSTPTVTTIGVPPISILAQTCNVDCNISSDGGSSIAEQGVYYSTVPFFDTESNPYKVFSTPGVGNYNVSLTSLSQNTTYYIRAYAINDDGIGISLGNMLTFKTPTLASWPSVTTSNVLSINKTTALGGGNVTRPGGRVLTAVGVCWNTSPNPTTANSFISSSVGLGPFTSNITGLTAGTTYYVCAYATNANGTAYGNEVVFVTEPIDNTITDSDGNTYSTVQIGTQTWMKENLKTKKYSDGSLITNAVDNTTWGNQTSGAYCWYNNDEATNKNSYGALYNYYAVIDSRNLCPTGWHVPSKDEWTDLGNYLGETAGGKLKEVGTAHWTTPNTGADNLSGFTALPGGSRSGAPDNTFDGNLGTFGWFWANTGSDVGFPYKYFVYYNGAALSYTGAQKIVGSSVRCIKDK